MLIFSALGILLLGLLPLPLLTRGEDEGAEQFQYKNIVLGILVDVSSIPVLNTYPDFQAQYLELIRSTIMKMNENNFLYTGVGGGGSAGPSSLPGAAGGAAAVTNGTRVLYIFRERPATFAISHDKTESRFTLRAENTTKAISDIRWHLANWRVLMEWPTIDILIRYKPNKKSHMRMSEVSTISIIQMHDRYDTLEAIPEMSALFTLLGCSETHYINGKIRKRFGTIVHIGITPPGCPRLDPASGVLLTLTYLKKNADLLQLLVDLRKDEILPSWRDAIVINDIEAGADIVDVFGEGFGSREGLTDIVHTVYKVNSMSQTIDFSNQIENIVHKYPRSSPGNYIVITKHSNINRVLEAVSRSGMLSILKQWVFISPDPTDPSFSWNYIETKIIDDGVNVAFIMNSSVTEEQNDFSRDVLCDTEALLSLLSDVVEYLAVWELDLYLQVSNEEWDVIKPSRVDRVVNITGTIMEKLSDRVIARCDKNESTWNLQAAENGLHGKQIFEVGWWNPLTGLRMTDDLLPHVTGGFRNRRINVASMHFPPWQLITRDPENEDNATYSGLIFEVLNHMAKDLNFTYTVIEPRPGETWGHRLSDGSWTGMMKMVAENKVVISASAFTVTAERSQYVDFTQVLEREAYGFMVNRPQELSRVLLFAAPFSYPVWICIGLTVLIVGPILHLVHSFSAYYDFHKMVTPEKGLYKLKNCYWYVYGSLLQQGGIHLPDALSGRMLLGFWWLFVIVTVTTYSGNLVAFLTFPKVESPVNTVEDLTNFDGVDSWGFLAGSVIEDHLKRSSDPKFEILYKKAIKHPAFNDTVLNMVSNHQHAYIDWKIVLLTALRDALKVTGRCEYIIGAETFFEEKIALAVPKNSPYLPIFNKQIGQMLQTGLLKKWKSRYWPGKDRCSLQVLSAGNRKVGLGDMQGCFYLLLMGFFISLIFLLIEFCVSYHRKKKMIEALKMIVTVAAEKKQQFWQQKPSLPKLPFLK